MSHKPNFDAVLLALAGDLQDASPAGRYRPMHLRARNSRVPDKALTLIPAGSLRKSRG